METAFDLCCGKTRFLKDFRIRQEVDAGSAVLRFPDLRQQPILIEFLYAGGKFDNNAYKTSGGLHGVGSSVVNALSTYLDVQVSLGGWVYHDRYERGVAVQELDEDGLLPKIGKPKNRQRADRRLSCTHCCRIYRRRAGL